MSDPISAAEEGSKAVTEVAKTAGKIVDAGRAMGGFIAKYTHGTLEEAMGIFHDKVAYSRWERQLRLMDRASAFLAERGLQKPPKGVALKFAVPLLHAATLEDDDYLQDMWAHLLVNASTNPETTEKKAFISMLENMSRLDAQILSELRRAEGTPNTPMLTYELPEIAHPVIDLSTTEPLKQPLDEVAFSLSNLARISAVTPAAMWDGGVTMAQVKLTILGRKLVDACSPDAESSGR